MFKACLYCYFHSLLKSQDFSFFTNVIFTVLAGCYRLGFALQYSQQHGGMIWYQIFSLSGLVVAGANEWWYSHGADLDGDDYVIWWWCVFMCPLVPLVGRFTTGPLTSQGCYGNGGPLLWKWCGLLLRKWWNSKHCDHVRYEQWYQINYLWVQYKLPDKTGFSVE